MSVDVVATPDIESTSLEEFEFEVACDYSGEDRKHWPVKNHGPAEWVVGVGAVCPHPKIRLLCTDCKDCLLTHEDGGMVCAICGEFIYPPRLTIRFIEKLERKR